MDGQVAFRPVVEDDLSWLASLMNDPAAIGPYEWHGWSDPQGLRKSWAESGLLGDDGGVLIVLHGTKRVGRVSGQVGVSAGNRECPASSGRPGMPRARQPLRPGLQRPARPLGPSA